MRYHLQGEEGLRRDGILPTRPRHEQFTLDKVYDVYYVQQVRKDPKTGATEFGQTETRHC